VNDPLDQGNLRRGVEGQIRLHEAAGASHTVAIIDSCSAPMLAKGRFLPARSATQGECSKTCPRAVAKAAGERRLSSQSVIRITCREVSHARATAGVARRETAA